MNESEKALEDRKPPSDLSNRAKADFISKPFFLKLIIVGMIFPTMAAVFMTFFEVPVMLIDYFAPRGARWAEILELAIMVPGIPISFYSAYRICRYVWPNRTDESSVHP